jgi:hypothetical protein
MPVDAVHDANLDKLKGQVKDFDQLQDLFPKNLPPEVVPLLKSYFEAQVMIRTNRLSEANAIFRERLIEKEEYLEMEDKNPQLLAAIDIVVRGETAMIVGEAKPSFTFSKN